MKFKQSEIEQLIQEELVRTRKQLVKEILGSTSKTEIEELLRIHFKEIGGIPDNISKLSVLFPILEKAGLTDLVDAYVEEASSGDKQAAYQILEPVREALSIIMRNK